LDAIVDEGSFLGRSLWRFNVRLPSDHVDLSTFMSTSIFIEESVWNNVFNNSMFYAIHTAGKCANNREKVCTENDNCLDMSTCITRRPNINMEIMATGGAAVPLQVEDSRLEIKLVEYDAMQASFEMRLRFNNEIANVMNVHVSEPLTAEAVATFNSDQFPCQPPGDGFVKQLFDNTGDFLCARSLPSPLRFV